MIKRFLLLATLLLLPNLAFAQEAFVIDSYHTEININTDSSLDITETIEANFSQQRHGIFRNIPLKYKDNFGNTKKLRISKINVSDEDGHQYPIELSGSSTKKIQIGDPDTLVTGLQTYVIHYKIERAINFFEDNDELYWNAIGTNWNTTIDNASASVNLPSKGALKATSFQGPTFSQEEASSSFTDDSYEFGASRLLNSHEGLTVVASWQKGVTNPISPLQNLIWFTQDNLLILLPLVYLVWLIRKFWRSGKDPAGRHTIVPEFAPPKLPMLQQAALKDEFLQTRDFSALIIKWAVDGFIKIEEPKKKQFTLIKTKDLTKASPKEEAFFKKIFTSDEVKLKELKAGKLSTASNKLKDEAFNQLVDGGYFTGNPRSVRNNYLALGGIIFFGAMFLFSLNPASAVLSILAGLLTLVFAPLMPKRTEKGVLEKEKILGFELYLKTAEKYRLEFAEKQHLFEKYLPYAIAFGVATIWAKAFKGILKDPPKWYSGVSSQAFVPLNFTQSLNSGLTSSMTSSVTTASSGGSGFSGGGVSGGFGGGGGGSW
ncbi:DUF2207 domain-containing protein [Candidatus Berkelbacteria bacterium]|nr:DUF2207 domain-containing protein [Candidatus Berkelbacteria bacterium]